MRVLEHSIKVIDAAQHARSESIRIRAESMYHLQKSYKILQRIYENHGLHLAMLAKLKERD